MLQNKKQTICCFLAAGLITSRPWSIGPLGSCDHVIWISRLGTGRLTWDPLVANGEQERVSKHSRQRSVRASKWSTMDSPSSTTQTQGSQLSYWQLKTSLLKSSRLGPLYSAVHCHHVHSPPEPTQAARGHAVSIELLRIASRLIHRLSRQGMSRSGPVDM